MILTNILESIIGDLTAALALQPALKFNGGGHINHTIFWKNLSPNGGGEPQGKNNLININFKRFKKNIKKQKHRFETKKQTAKNIKQQNIDLRLLLVV